MRHDEIRLSVLWYAEALACLYKAFASHAAVVIVVPYDYPDPPDTVLTADELENTKRFRYTADGRAHALGRLTARYFLDRGAMPFSLTKHGKPYLKGAIDFSISHAASLVVVAFSSCGAIGVDVEKVSDESFYSSLHKLVCHPRELDWLERVPTSCRSVSFVDIWTRKEALLKAEGTGLIDRLNTVEVAPWSQVGLAENSGRWRLWSLPIDDQSVRCAVATNCSISNAIVLRAGRGSVELQAVDRF